MPGTVFAQAVCNGNINLGYSGGPNFAAAGSTYTVEAALGTGTITGGAANTLTINRFRFQLDCNAAFALGIPCTDEGAFVSYAGNIDDTGCPAGAPWSAVAAGNEVTFTPTAPVVIPANTAPAAGCVIEFDVTVDAVPSIDVTPGQIEEVVGYSVANTDAQCDNGLTSGANQSGAIPVCPACGEPGEECFEPSVCDQQTGQCVNPPS
ncbi:MAG: hypothetical protein R3212_02355, partial [Xanthomonadales bacterium]|nr:hypothetical protein [Xanthomonadales bacterium]